jgi:hypothetical protein
MNNIIPQSINDKINTLFTLVNRVYESFVNLTSNYFFIDTSSNEVSISGNTFTIDVSNNQINLGDKTDPDIMILHGTSDISTITQTNIPNGSLFLTQYNDGEAYLRVNGEWKKIITT